MASNYRQIFARKNALKGKVLRLCPNAENRSGIYAFTRVDENGVGHFYVGQAVACLNRLVSHLEGYDSHIDLSIRKWGLYEPIKNPQGYKIHILEYTENLDEREKYWIMEYLKKGLQSKNVSFGGQGKGKSHLNENKQGKGYHEGVAYGQVKAMRKVKEFFDKYLDYSIKGKPNKIKERKLREFEELLKGEQENV